MKSTITVNADLYILNLLVSQFNLFWLSLLDTVSIMFN